jgi:membrane protein DedA with SNARE-associated domain
MNLDILLMEYGLLAIFLLLLVKSIGVPVPIPEDLILLAVAVRAAEGKFILWEAFVVALIPIVIGQLIQFLLARGPGRGVLFRFGRYLGLTPARLDAASARVKKGGIIGITITLVIPGIRSVALVASGLAGLPLSIFLPALVVSRALSIGLHFVLGYVGDSLFVELGKVLPTSSILVLVVVFLLIVFALWAVARYRRKTAPHERGAAVLEQWHEGICPVCLALSAASPLLPLAKEPGQ